MKEERRGIGGEEARQDGSWQRMWNGKFYSVARWEG